jgi:hypothetical protein
MWFKSVPVAFLFILFTAAGAAVCGGTFTGPGSFVELDDRSQAFLSYHHTEQLEQLVIRPSYHGRAGDFGIVYPTPSRPTVTGSTDDLFRQLNDLTRPEDDEFTTFTPFLSTLGNVGSGVDIVSQQEVGDFEATVLRADSLTALQDWLTANNYTLPDHVRDNLRFYIEQNSTYFTALKINIDEADCLSRETYRERLKDNSQNSAAGNRTGQEGCYLSGGLSPIQLAFKTDRPMIPFRIMAHQDGNGSTKNMLLYTYGSQPYLAPGARATLINEVEDVAEPLAQYGSRRFLTRQELTLDENNIRDDLYLRPVAATYLPAGTGRAVPDKASAGAGTVPPDDPRLDVSYSDRPSVLSYLIFVLRRGAGIGLEAALYGIAGAITGTFLLPLLLPVLLLGGLITPLILGGLLLTRRNALRIMPALIGGITLLGLLTDRGMAVTHGSTSSIAYTLTQLTTTSTGAGLTATVMVFLAGSILGKSGHVQDLRQRFSFNRDESPDRKTLWAWCGLVFLLGMFFLHVGANL